MTATIHWSAVTLFDSAGYILNDEQIHRELMRGYRDTEFITDYWMVDPDSVNDDCLAWDEFHHELRYPEDAGPSVAEIDWTGIDEPTP